MPAKRAHPDAGLVADIVEHFSTFALVTSRSMFGGYGLFVDGAMFALVADGALYLKADDANRHRFEAAGMQPWTYETRGRAMQMGYYPIPEDDLHDSAELRAWFEGARDASRRAAEQKRTKAPRSS